MFNKKLRSWKVLIDNMQQLSAADIEFEPILDGQICKRAAQPHADVVAAYMQRRKK